MNRWIIGEKKDGYFGSTQDTATVIRALSTYLESTGELKNVNMNAKIVLDSETLASKSIDQKNALERFEVKKSIAGLGDNTLFHAEKQ